MAPISNFVASEHNIKSVTVFKSSRAEIVRTFPVQLEKGQNKVKIEGLSSSIDTHSIRVSGLGNARLFDVVCTLEKSNKDSTTFTTDGASEVVRALTVKKKALESERAIRENESQLLLKYAQSLSGEHVTPVQMSQFLESYVAQGRKTVEAITTLNEQIVQVDREIDEEKEKSSSKKGSNRGRVDVVLFAEEEAAVDLKLTYLVDNAQWKPTYELHASSENGKPSKSVTLRYRARVMQQTGEDWNNTSLMLSSVASDMVVEQIPQLRQRKIQPKIRRGGLFGPSTQPVSSLFGPPPPGPSVFSSAPAVATTSLFGASNPGFAPPQQAFGGGGAQGRGGFGATAGVATFGQPQQQQQQGQEPNQFVQTATTAPVVEDDVGLDFEAVDTVSPITENKTIVSETPVAVSFAVQGESTIPSDGIDHQVSVAELPFSAKISYITIPRIDPRVFLQCEVTNGSEYRLLPGPVTVILDDSYVSKTQITKDISTGETFECTLGADEATKVTYARTSKTVKSDGGAFSENTNTTTYNTKITVYNKHQFAINDLIIRDAVPTCDDKRAKIVLQKPVGLADAKDGQVVDLKNQGLKVQWQPLVDGKGGYKEGKFEWKWNVNTGAKVVVEAEWDVKSTGDTEWIEGF
ncbi:hypothetical protein CPC08DRAFT_768987 [Agrocybe pediades]|nr:hypothetical protein CPC08DRAFT_768987 [Agrocybe pediades]